MHQPTVVILGGGYAGLMAASRLARQKVARVLLIDRNATFVQRIRLHQMLAGDTIPAAPLAQWLAPAILAALEDAEEPLSRVRDFIEDTFRPTFEKLHEVWVEDILPSLSELRDAFEQRSQRLEQDARVGGGGPDRVRARDPGEVVEPEPDRDRAPHPAAVEDLARIERGGGERQSRGIGHDQPDSLADSGPSQAIAAEITKAVVCGLARSTPKDVARAGEAVELAARLVKANPELAADIFLRTNQSKIDRTLLLSIIRSPEVDFKLAPENTYALAAFMHRVGAIKNRPASVKDYFFDDAHNAAYSQPNPYSARRLR